MRQGMHALAQPITLLQSYFYLAGLDAGRGTPVSQHFADAASGVEHLCALFRILQEILQVQGARVEIARVSAQRAIAPLLEDAEAVLAGSGSSLLLPEPVALSGPSVAIDLKLLRQAWMSSLHVVREACRPNSTVRCSFALEAGHWVICLAPTRPKATPVPFDDASDLHLALATISLHRQGGHLHRVDDPFSLLAHLPVAERAPTVQPLYDEPR